MSPRRAFLRRPTVVLAAGLLALGSAVPGRAGEAGPPSAYLEAAKAEALRFAPSGARVVRAVVGAAPNEGMVVCGALEVGGERLPFATLWDPDRPPAKGSTLVGLTARERKQRRHGEAYHASIRQVCERAGLARALPGRN